MNEKATLSAMGSLYTCSKNHVQQYGNADYACDDVQSSQPDHIAARSRIVFGVAFLVLL
jgi:hypothetical protein